MIDIINTIIRAIGEAGTEIVSWLPQDPFSTWQNPLSGQLLRWINWIIPISEMIGILGSWGVAIGLWYIISIALRWIKAIE